MQIEGTRFEEIYERFSKKVTDFDIYELMCSKDPETRKFVEDMLNGYLISAVSKFWKCEKDLSQRNEALKQFNVLLDDLEIEILALMMVTEWIEPQLNSTAYTHQFIGGVNQKFYAQSNQLSQLQSLEEKSRKKTKQLIHNYTYKTSINRINGGN